MNSFNTTYGEPALGGHANARDRALLGPVMVTSYVAITVSFAALGAYLGRDLSGTAGQALFVVAFALIVGLNAASVKCREQPAIALPFALGLVLGLATAPLIAHYADADPAAVWQAAGTTAALVATLAVYTTRGDLTTRTRALFWALLALIAFGVVSIVVSIPSHAIHAVAGLVILGGFTIFDFNRRRRSTPDAAIPIAASIVPRHFQHFLLVAELFGGRRE